MRFIYISSLLLKVFSYIAFFDLLEVLILTNLYPNVAQLLMTLVFSKKYILTKNLLGYFLFQRLVKLLGSSELWNTLSAHLS